MQKGDRSFTVVSSSLGRKFEGGRFINRAPRNAAIKAAGQMFSEMDDAGGKTPSSLTLEIREKTRGSSNRRFAYRASRRKVDKSFEAGGRTIPVTQEVTVKSIDTAKTRQRDKKTKGGDGNGNFEELQKRQDMIYSKLLKAVEDGEDDGLLDIIEEVLKDEFMLDFLSAFTFADDEHKAIFNDVTNTTEENMDGFENFRNKVDAYRKSHQEKLKTISQGDYFDADSKLKSSLYEDETLEKIASIERSNSTGKLTLPGFLIRIGVPFSVRQEASLQRKDDYEETASVKAKYTLNIKLNRSDFKFAKLWKESSLDISVFHVKSDQDKVRLSDFKDDIGVPKTEYDAQSEGGEYYKIYKEFFRTVYQKNEFYNYIKKYAEYIMVSEVLEYMENLFKPRDVKVMIAQPKPETSFLQEMKSVLDGTSASKKIYVKLQLDVQESGAYLYRLKNVSEP